MYISSVYIFTLNVGSWGNYAYYMATCHKDWLVILKRKQGACLTPVTTLSYIVFSRRLIEEHAILHTVVINGVLFS